MSESSIIQEGFLCPICHKDMRSPNNLIAHFQDLHSEEQDILKSIKDLYGRAKKKILKLDDPDLETVKNQIAFDRYDVEYCIPQDPGHFQSHTDLFKSVRRERLDHRTTETNKLIIRLDRLLRFDGNDRKQQEQEVVAWLDGSTVTRCPSCAASFNITRRQHHCRLCGSVMCNSCSIFLSHDIAQTIVAPVYNMDRNKSEKKISSGKENDNLRICSHCLSMLENRRRLQLSQMIQPMICQLYSHLRSLKIETQTSVDLYQKIYDSLTAGETSYQLQDAQALRSSLAKKAEMMDVLSKKIAALPVDPETPRMATLQHNIQSSTSHYIKENLLTLPAPPSPQELENIKRECSLKFAEHERPASNNPGIRKVTVTTGWSPASVSNDFIDQPDNDPFVEQIRIVQNYIDQARKAERFEEVASLRANLKMLEDERRKMRDERLLQRRSNHE